MATRAKINAVLRHLPKGRKLPAKFETYLELEKRYRVQWNDLDAYGLKPTACGQAFPFLRLADGGLVALWYHAASPAVVHIGGHGELEVIAQSFADFLRGIKTRCTGLADFDEDEEAPPTIAGVTGMSKRDRVSALQLRLKEWYQAHTSLLKPLVSPDAEALRQQVCGIAEGMIRDGRSKVYKPAVLAPDASPSWWAMQFRLSRDGVKFEIEYLDYGEWYPVPKKYGLVPVVASLLALVQDKEREKYELAVISAGIVSIDRDRQLVLVPPGMKFDETAS